MSILFYGFYMGVKVNTGDRVKFRVYTDNDGAGACSITTA